MTWSEVVRVLKKHGCKFKCYDKKHDVYYNPNIEGKPEAEIPRHWTQEARKGTVEDIFKTLGIKK